MIGGLMSKLKNSTELKDLKVFLVPKRKKFRQSKGVSRANERQISFKQSEWRND